MTSPNKLPDGGNDALCLDTLLAEALASDDHQRVGFLAALCLIDRDIGRDEDLARLRFLNELPVITAL